MHPSDQQNRFPIAALVGAFVVAMLVLTAGGLWYLVKRNQADAEGKLARATELTEQQQRATAADEVAREHIEELRRQKKAADEEAAENARRRVREFRAQWHSRPKRFQFEKLLEKAEDVATRGATEQAWDYLDEAETLYPNDALTVHLREKIRLIDASKKAIEVRRQK